MRIGWFGRPALWVVLLTAPLSAALGGEPQVFLDRGGRLVVSALPPILGDAEVARHLDSGLTTSFVFQVRRQGPVKAGAARIDVRFELWDEVYLATVIDGQGAVEKHEHDSAKALSKWWSEAEIVLSTSSGATPIAGSQARVSLAVVPFSQAELVDTQKWLTESMAQGGSRSGNEGGGPRAVSALIATSMQRRAVRSMTWNLPISRRDQP